MIARAAINRIKCMTPAFMATGDDDGVVKASCLLALSIPVTDFIPQLWDPRRAQSIRSYNHHFDFISDFLYIENENKLVVTR